MKPDNFFSENVWFSDNFKGNRNQLLKFAQLIPDTKFGSDPLPSEVYNVFVYEKLDKNRRTLFSLLLFSIFNDRYLFRLFVI